MRLKVIAGLFLLLAILLIVGFSIQHPEDKAGMPSSGETRRVQSQMPEEAMLPSHAPSPASSDGSISVPPRPQQVEVPYGQQVDSALASNDGRAAINAVYAMERCGSVDRLAADSFKMRDTISDPKLRRGYALIAEEFQREQRSCQSLSDLHKSQKSDLLKIASNAGIQGASLRYLTQSTEVVDRDTETKKRAIENIQAEARAGSRDAIMLLGVQGESYGLPLEAQWAFAAAATWIQKNEGTGISQIDDLLLTAFEIASIPPGTPDEVVKRVQAAAAQIRGRI